MPTYAVVELPGSSMMLSIRSSFNSVLPLPPVDT